ncbi:hypothetical protein AN9485.2 [Aspergillus nidulans FGSC A4]|uniref:Uncharacterized protein n=1 Tax=Emericella nidulans (strain FGSC A4 / ATCC 38163 / CBS 112.46 / NRRL 194 / M139) TaxID=227321 RepID=Q5AQE5_EMENI|nr:hypothetical protein [Aspergillus nidulans FGSC A4]EAA66776.1 hypothetical protein AN9485.2 [Aspergillus nidulans FGSC A4]CBF76816.1 TPA: conserved hypothetical protein [Aspergillus nidulans FGSC A4]|eukprot:XP_868867.1 hypothetical protein AN9485.2 [Aspergillus nidulans FGSC A4]
MSSMDYEIANPHTRPYYGHQRHHTVNASPVPAYVNRSVPTYSLMNQEQMPQPNSLASPRHSPNIQPWKRQQPQSSLSFIPSTSPRFEQSEYTMSQSRRPLDRGTACISPFRSVRKMKEPFQLRLPASPSVDNSSLAPGESRVTSRPTETRTLRPWRSEQNLVASGLDTFGLLPSPPLSDSQPSQASPASTYFSSKSASETEADRETDCSCLPQAVSCNHCTPQTPATEVSVQSRKFEATNVHMAHSTFVRQYSLGKRNFSGSSAATQRSRSGTVSSEGSWVPSSLSYCETWLQGAPMDSAEDEAGKSTISNRRKFQIVQKSPLVPDWKRAHNDAVLAVKSKMKPKLVDISRQSSPAMSYSLPTPTHPIPATPDHSLPEVSAFSPDTPLELSDSGYATQNPVFLPKNRKGGGESLNTDQCSVASGTMGKTIIGDPGAGNGDESETEPKPPPHKVAPPSEQQASPRAASTKSDKEELEKLWDHEWTIDQLEHSVNDFPQNMLRLTSPVVVFLRHNQERALMRPFRQIFPNAPTSILDSLCAVLIAKNYLLSLPSLSRKTTNMQLSAQISRLDTVPEKANSILGMKFAQPQPSRIRDQVLGSRSSKLLEDLDSILDNLLFTLRGPHDEALKSAVLVLMQVLETKA